MLSFLWLAEIFFCLLFSWSWYSFISARNSLLQYPPVWDILKFLRDSLQLYFLLIKIFFYLGKISFGWIFFWSRYSLIWARYSPVLYSTDQDILWFGRDILLLYILLFDIFFYLGDIFFCSILSCSRYSFFEWDIWERYSSVFNCCRVSVWTSLGCVLTDLSCETSPELGRALSTHGIRTPQELTPTPLKPLLQQAGTF